MTKIYQKISEISDLELTKTMAEYVEIKGKNSNCIVLFQIGEFYEAYLDDARIISEECSVFLTKRKIKEGFILMAGIPQKSLEEYVLKLTDSNRKVMICTQEEKENGQFERKIKRIYTKGMLFEGDMLNSSKNNYIAAIYEEKGLAGLACADISTGELYVCEGNINDILNELKIIEPVEVLLSVKAREIAPFQVVDEPEPDIKGDFSDYNVTLVKKSSFNVPKGHEKGLGYRCANAIFEYSKMTNKDYAPKFGDIRTYNLSDYMMIDEMTSYNLELFKTKENTYKGSFLWAIDKTVTSMGKRLLTNWVKKPLKNIKRIEERELALEEYIKSPNIRDIQNILKNCYDIKRLWGKLTNKSFTEKDFLSLKTTLNQGVSLYNYIKDFKSPLLKINEETMSDIKSLFDILDNSLSDEEGKIFKTESNGSLSAITNEIKNCLLKLDELEKQEREKIGIKSLKLNNNAVLGYFMEVSNSNISKLPSYFKIRQNLTNFSRYVTPELIILNEKLNSLNYQKNNIESEILGKLKEFLIKFSDSVYELGNKLSVIDVINSYYEISKDKDYTRPKIKENKYVKLKGVKHPLGVLITDNYIPNDFEITDERRFKLLTGPNMAGKSTYIKSVALNIILAQIGSYTCDKEHETYIFDKIFVHSRTDDYINKGSSTFMSEMMGVKNILDNATENSLILFDELGRGTSTSDGVKLAYSISKYVIDKINAVTIFATHFHKLKVLYENYQNKIQPLMIGKDFDIEKKVFDRHVKEGFLDESYGINVARAAGLPKEIIADANKFEV